MSSSSSPVLSVFEQALKRACCIDIRERALGTAELRKLISSSTTSSSSDGSVALNLLLRVAKNATAALSPSFEVGESINLSDTNAEGKFTALATVLLGMRDAQTTFTLQDIAAATTIAYDAALCALTVKPVLTTENDTLAEISTVNVSILHASGATVLGALVTLNECISDSNASVSKALFQCTRVTNDFPLKAAALAACSNLVDRNGHVASYFLAELVPVLVFGRYWGMDSMRGKAQEAWRKLVQAIEIEAGEGGAGRRGVTKNGFLSIAVKNTLSNQHHHHPRRLSRAAAAFFAPGAEGGSRAGPILINSYADSLVEHICSTAFAASNLLSSSLTSTPVSNNLNIMSIFAACADGEASSHCAGEIASKLNLSTFNFEQLLTSILSLLLLIDEKVSLLLAAAQAQEQKQIKQPQAAPWIPRWWTIYIGISALRSAAITASSRLLHAMADIADNDMDTLRIAQLTSLWIRATLCDASADTRAVAAVAVGGVLLRWPAIARPIALASIAVLNGRRSACELAGEHSLHMALLEPQGMPAESSTTTGTGTETRAVVISQGDLEVQVSDDNARCGASLLIRELACTVSDIPETFLAIETLSTSIIIAAKTKASALTTMTTPSKFLETAWRALPDAFSGVGRIRARRLLGGWISALGATLRLLDGGGNGGGNASASLQAALDAILSLSESVGSSVFEARLDDDEEDSRIIRRVLDQTARGGEGYGRRLS